MPAFASSRHIRNPQTRSCAVPSASGNSQPQPKKIPHHLSHLSKSQPGNRPPPSHNKGGAISSLLEIIMATKAQINTNRQNATKSNGPRTPERKASAPKSKSSVRTRTPPSTSLSFSRSTMSSSPNCEAEVKLVDRIAAPNSVSAAPPLSKWTSTTSSARSLPARAFLDDAHNANTFTKLSRYKTTLDRSIERNTKLLQNLQAIREQQIAEQTQSDVNPTNTDTYSQTAAPLSARAEARR